MCSKACSVESTASTLMPGDVLERGMEYCIDVYNPIKLKRYLINLAYLGVKLKKTLAITCEEFRCRNIQTEDKEVFHSSKVNIQLFFFCYNDVLHTISSAS